MKSTDSRRSISDATVLAVCIELLHQMALPNESAFHISLRHLPGDPEMKIPIWRGWMKVPPPSYIWPGIFIAPILAVIIALLLRCSP